MKEILSSELVKKRTVSYEPIDDTYCKYKDITNMTTNGKKSRMVDTGVATIKEVENLKEFSTISHKVDVDWMYEKIGFICPVLKEGLDKLALGEVHISELAYKYKANVNKTSEEDYVYCIYNHGAWQLANLDKTAIPYPIYFDYTAGHITDSKFDLNRVLEFMNNDPRFIPAKFNKEDELHIKKIPYYNADSNIGYHAIEFCYIPTSEKEMRLLLALHSYDRGNYIESLLNEFKLEKNPYGEDDNEYYGY